MDYRQDQDKYCTSERASILMLVYCQLRKSGAAKSH